MIMRGTGVSPAPWKHIFTTKVTKDDPQEMKELRQRGPRSSPPPSFPFPFLSFVVDPCFPSSGMACSGHPETVPASITAAPVFGGHESHQILANISRQQITLWAL